MVTKTCIHPIRANRIIDNFVNNLCILPEDTYFVIKSLTSNEVNYYVDGTIGEDEEIEIFVPRWRYADYSHDFGGKLFRQDFVKRCPKARGFSDVTLSILHEIGHKMTEHNLPINYDRAVEMAYVEITAKNPTQRCKMYFSMTDETLATNWAIEWLNDAKNRKRAKAFEKKFFTCFK